MWCQHTGWRPNRESDEIWAGSDVTVQPVCQAECLPSSAAHNYTLRHSHSEADGRSAGHQIPRYFTELGSLIPSLQEPPMEPIVSQLNPSYRGYIPQPGWRNRTNPWQWDLVLAANIIIKRTLGCDVVYLDRWETTLTKVQPWTWRRCTPPQGWCTWVPNYTASYPKRLHNLWIPYRTCDNIGQPWASSIPFSRTLPNTNTGRFSGKTLSLSLPQHQPAKNYGNWYSVVTLRRLH